MRLPAITAGSVPLAAVLIFGSGCATMTAEECDPTQVGNVVRSARCQPAFEARLEALRAEIDRVLAETSAAGTETEAYLEEARRLERNSSALTARLDSMQLSLAALESELAVLRRDSEEQRAVVDAMEAQLAAAQREVADIRRRDEAAASEIAALEASTAAKREAISALLGIYGRYE